MSSVKAVPGGGTGRGGRADVAVAVAVAVAVDVDVDVDVLLRQFVDGGAQIALVPGEVGMRIAQQPEDALRLGRGIRELLGGLGHELP
ncbi:hypothetical protein [Streptomyces sp. NPDC054783]